MTSYDVQALREMTYHNQKEFADLVGRLRGVPVSRRTVEGWERDNGRRIEFYLTDVEAIMRATRPRGRVCKAPDHGSTCGRRAVIRKSECDMCAECATESAWGKAPKNVKKRLTYYVVSV